MKQEHWLLESAIFLAVSTGVLYAFGGYYDYRIRYEFNIPTITLGHSPETLIHNGASIFFGWLGTSTEFWIALSLVTLITLLLVYVPRQFKTIRISNVVLLSASLGAIISFMSVNLYIPSRAKDNAQSIMRIAPAKKHSLLMRDGSEVKGYTIIGTPSKVAFFSSDKKVLVVPYAEIKRLMTDE